MDFAQLIRSGELFVASLGSQVTVALGNLTAARESGKSCDNLKTLNPTGIVRLSIFIFACL